MTVEMFNAITRLAAALIPLTSVCIIVWYNRRTLRQMDAKLEEMRRLDRRRVMSKLDTNSRYGKGSLN